MKELEKVQTLLNKGVDVNSKDKLNQTAFIFASDKGHDKVVSAIVFQLLLEANANVDAQEEKKKVKRH